MSKRAFMKVTTQGDVSVSGARIEAEGDGLVAIAIDTDKQWPKIWGIGAEPALNLVCNDAPGYNSTIVEFPRFRGWKVHSAQAGPYQVNVCLVRRKAKK